MIEVAVSSLVCGLAFDQHFPETNNVTATQGHFTHTHRTYLLFKTIIYIKYLSNQADLDNESCVQQHTEASTLNDNLLLLLADYTFLILVIKDIFVSI